MTPTPPLASRNVTVDVLPAASVAPDLFGEDARRQPAAQVRAHVHEVANFTEDAPAAFDRIHDPAVARHDARVDAIGHEQRLGDAREELAALDGERREPPVEADHEPRVGVGLHRLDHVGQAGGVDRQRLLDEYRLAGADRRGGQPRVLIVARRDDHGVDVRIDDHFVGIARAIFGAVLRADVAAGVAGRRANRLQVDALLRRERGQQHALRELAGADDATAQLIARRPSNRGRARHQIHARTGRDLAVVLEQDRHGRLGTLTRHDLIGRLGVVDREPMRDKWRERDVAAGQQIEERLHVPAFRPSDVGGRIVVTADFVRRDRSGPGRRSG